MGSPPSLRLRNRQGGRRFPLAVVASTQRTSHEKPGSKKLARLCRGGKAWNVFQLFHPLTVENNLAVVDFRQKTLSLWAVWF